MSVVDVAGSRVEKEELGTQRTSRQISGEVKGS